MIVGVFFLVPLVLVFWMSVNRWPLLGSPTFNVPDNYTDIPDNRLFRDSVVFTLKYTAIVTVALSAVAMALALMVQQPRRGVGLIRTAYFVPGAVGFAAAALLFYGFYSETGPLNDILTTFGFIDEPVAWLGTPDRALFSTIAMVIWRFAGFNMLILLTGLQSIPTELYDAARVDGAKQLADVPSHHAAAAATDDRADARAEHHRIAAGVRPVLHPHPRRPGRQHGLDGDGHLPRGVHPVRPRRRRRAVGRAAGRAGRLQRRSAARDRPPGAVDMTGSRRAGQAAFYTSGVVLSLLFAFPLLWGAYSSVKGQPGSSQETGFGFDNYAAMARFGEGVGTYLFNSAAVSAMTVVGTLFVSCLGGYGFARFQFPGKNLLFLATLAILMVPYATILIPLYVVLGHLGLQNSLVGPEPRADHVPAAVRAVHDAQLVRGDPARARGGRARRRMHDVLRAAARSCSMRSARA